MHRHKKSLEQFRKNAWDMFRTSALVRWSFFASVIFVALAFILPIVRILPLEAPFIVLHYNIYLGADRFGPVGALFYLPITSLVFFVGNTLIQAHAWRRQKMVSQVFAGATPLITFIFLVATALIVLINL